METRAARESIPDEMLGLDLAPGESALWVAFLVAHSCVVRRLERDLEAAGVSFSDHQALIAIGAAGEQGIRMSDLSEHVLLTRSAVTRLVDRLTRDGLVERRECAEDKRGMFVCLTNAGREHVRRVAPIHLRGMRESFFDRIPPDSRKGFLEALQAIAAIRE